MQAIVAVAENEVLRKKFVVLTVRAEDGTFVSSFSLEGKAARVISKQLNDASNECERTILVGNMNPDA